MERLLEMVSGECREEIHVFKRWLKHFFLGKDEPVVEEIKDKLAELDEVKTMMMTHLEKRDKEQFEKGIKIGIVKGVEKGVVEGKKKGLEEGQLLAKKSMLITLIRKRYGLTEEERSIIIQVQDGKILDKAIERFANAKRKESVIDIVKVN